MVRLTMIAMRATPLATLLNLQLASGGQKFVIGDGNKIANDAQVNLNLQTTSGSLNDIMSTFQVAKVSRPLWSVGKTCENDMDVLVNQIRAKVLTRGGDTICTFERRIGGLYVAKFRFRRPGTPTPFVRQGGSLRAMPSSPISTLVSRSISSTSSFLRIVDDDVWDIVESSDESNAFSGHPGPNPSFDEEPIGGLRRRKMLQKC